MAKLDELLSKLDALVAEIKSAAGSEAPAEPEAEEVVEEGGEEEGSGLDDGKKAAMVAMLKRKHGV